ncbi:MAG: hypothetical protein R2991_06615 [Thermoanaerobaculia bacterium]
MPERPTPWAAALPALALFAVWRVLAQATPRPTEAAEATFLALPLALVALAAGSIARRRAPVSLCILGLALLALLPGTGGARAVSVGALCVLTLAVALLDRGAAANLSERVALAVALQALLRPDLLLAPAPSWHLLARLVLLPVLAAWASDLLAAERGDPAASIAAGSAVVVEGWFGPATCTALLVAALVERVPGWRRARWERRAAAAALLLGASLAIFGGAADWRSTLLSPALLLVILPGALLASPRRWLVMAALAAGGTRFFGPEGWVLVPSALLLALGPLAGHRLRRMQVGWTGLLLLAGAATSFYPWMRHRPLAWLEALAPPIPPWATGLAVVAISVPLVRARRPWRLLALLLVALGWWRAQPTEILLAEPELLNTDRPSWSRDLAPPRTLSTLTIESYLTGAASLPAASEVAEIELTLADGTAQRHTLRLGLETADRDAELANGGSWLAEVDAAGRFAPVFRARWPLGEGREVTGLTVRLRGQRPAGARLVLLQIGGAP